MPFVQSNISETRPTKYPCPNAFPQLSCSCPEPTIQILIVKICTEPRGLPGCFPSKFSKGNGLPGNFRVWYFFRFQLYLRTQHLHGVKHQPLIWICIKTLMPSGALVNA